MATHNEALREAYASCPPSAQLYVTLEVMHPTFAEPARIVANVADDMQFGIEDGADYDAGELVTFIACPLRADYPEQREGQAPTSKISIDDVAAELVPKIRAAMALRAPITVAYREYLGSDLSEPAYGPVTFELKHVQLRGATLTGQATVGNLQSKRFPRQSKNYTYQQFRSLLP